MPKITLSCPIHSSYRVHQVAGMFDVPITDKAERVIEFDDLPLDDPTWKIGCIVGPSGSGKTSIAKRMQESGGKRGGQEEGGQKTQAFFSSSSPASYPPDSFSPNTAVIDGFGDHSVKEITKVLTLVGFSSPPSWIKPYSVLSNGEKFRCDLAKALLGAEEKGGQEAGGQKAQAFFSSSSPDSCPPSPTVVFDEYTSVVDRNVAKIASAALSKSIKSGRLNCRFIAVTCHYDILDWLEPDWVLDTATGKVERRFLRRQGTSGARWQRPSIELEIFRCERSLWDMFKTHHYLSGSLANSCRCYAATWQGKPVAFCALIPQYGFKRWYRVSRIVTLPDYQGIGIGSRFLDSLAELYVQQDYRFSITASHPSVISHCKRSSYWKAINVQKTGSTHSRGRAVVSFEWC